MQLSAAIELLHGITYSMCLIGTFIGFGLEGLLIFLLTSLLFIVMVLIFKPRYKYLDETRNEKQKLGKYLLASVFVVQVGKMFFDMFLIYDVLVSIMTGIIVYIFYKIFANSLSVIKEYGIKKVFSVEEVIGASLLVSIALVSFSSVTVYGLSITNIFCIMLVLFLGWRNGMLVGATSGLTIGMVLGIITNAGPILIASFALSRNACTEY